MWNDEEQRKSQYEMVKEFHQEAGQLVGAPIEFEDWVERVKIVKEEVDELIAEINRITRMAGHPSQYDLADLLKEMADVIYVLNGTAVAFGWNLDEAFERVHESNMTKLEGRDKKAKGKVEKGENYQPPHLEDLI